MQLPSGGAKRGEREREIESESESESESERQDARGPCPLAPRKNGLSAQEGRKEESDCWRRRRGVTSEKTERGNKGGGKERGDREAVGRGAG